ncbi:MAG: HNH endonuclease signature motif containing protein [Cellulophaga sp.]|uniref:HNH endonuclease n=1 Tax=Cellulophaga sp. TaxID=1972202 RepID=UPI003267ED19
MDELHFNNIYHFASMVESSIFSEENFWNYPEEYFIERAISFKKETLLHLYIETTIWNHYNYDIRKSTDFYIDDAGFFEYVRELSISYNVNFEYLDEKIDFETYEGDDLDQKLKDWWNNNEIKFRELFNKIADDVFYILFGNRMLLLKFNQLVAKNVYDTTFPKENLNTSGKLKRKYIPQWVKKAVFLRDKGRCTKCSRDLTGLIAVDTKQHYDHIVPLNQFGANDPTNMQLLCESCNLKKSGNKIETSKLYIKWWK